MYTRWSLSYEHTRAYIYKISVCLNRILERQCWSCKCLYSGVNSPIDVLNVVGIHEPLHE